MSPRFTFETTIHGQGGFAKVRKGRDNILERDIAVKFLTPLVATNQGPDLERFKREARILAKLTHPNIPAIYDVDFTDKNFLIIFQYIEGPTLETVIASEGACAVNQAKHGHQAVVWVNSGAFWGSAAN
jgi:serine/threonine-protein kinase